jgi:hypothetical protein
VYTIMYILHGARPGFCQLKLLIVSEIVDANADANAGESRRFEAVNSEHNEVILNLRRPSADPCGRPKSHLHTEGRRFEPCIAHQVPYNATVKF